MNPVEAPVRLICPECGAPLSNLACPSCDTVFEQRGQAGVLLSGRSHAKYAELYEAIAVSKGDHQEFYRRFAPGRKLGAILALVPREAQSVADIGCGDGILLEKVGGLLDNADLVGVDISATRLERACRRTRMTPIVADIAALPFAPGQFDLTLCSEVIEHIPEPERAIAELARITRPGGRIVVSVPLAGWNRTLRSLMGQRVAYLDEEEHLREYATVSMQRFTPVTELFDSLDRHRIKVLRTKGAYFYEWRLAERALNKYGRGGLGWLPRLVDRFLGGLPLIRLYGRYLIVSGQRLS